LSFLAPADGATVPAGDVTVSIIVEDFVLVDHVARPSPLSLFVPAAWADADEDGVPAGHCVLSLDGAEVAQMAETQLVLTVGPGAHTLDGELRYEDDDPLDPRVTASVSFTAQ
jgi:hypothetical protein